MLIVGLLHIFFNGDQSLEDKYYFKAGILNSRRISLMIFYILTINQLKIT